MSYANLVPRVSLLNNSAGPWERGSVGLFDVFSYLVILIYFYICIFFVKLNLLVKNIEALNATKNGSLRVRK